jgi:hypothetical protein
VSLARSAVVLTVLVVLSACTPSDSQPAPSPTPTHTSHAVSLPSCPLRAPPLHRDDLAPANELVWPNPVVGRLCRYFPLFGRTGKGVPHGTLYGQAQLSASSAGRLAHALNAIPQVAAGERIACPAALGTHDLLFFGYVAHPNVVVLATPDGCPSFTNGRYKSGDFSPGYAHYLRQVNHLVHPKPAHP